MLNNFRDLEKLMRHLPFAGKLRRLAAETFAGVASPEAVRLCAEAVTVIEDEPIRQLALTALQRLTDQRQIDVVCEVWARTRHRTLARLLRERGWVAATPLELRVLTALHVGRRDDLAQSKGAEVITALINLRHDIDPAIVRNARQSLLKLKDADAIDTLCARWAAQRAPWLTDILREAGYIAAQPPDVRVLCALLLGRSDLIAAEGANVLEPLLHACQDADGALAERAQALLKQVSLSDPETRERLCRFVMEHEHPIARQIVIEAHYAPNDPQQRALLYFLTEQWERYEQFDFDRHFLQTAYSATTEHVKQRMRELVRKTGRLEFVTMLVGEHATKRIGELTDADWDTTLHVLAQRQAGPEMFRLAQIAPAIWSARLFRQLRRSAWQPAVAQDQAGFEQLTGLAAQCDVETARTSAHGYHHATLEGHTGSVIAVDFSPDGQMLASGGGDHAIRLWRLPDGEAIKTLTGHEWTVCGVAISPDGQLLASGSDYDGAVRLWRLPEGEALKGLTTFSGQNIGFVNRGVSSLAISPDGRLLACGGRDDAIRLWRLPEGEELALLAGQPALVIGVAFGPDGRFMVSASGDGVMRMWQLPELEIMKTFTGYAFALSPDGRLLVSAGRDDALRAWQLPDGEALWTFPEQGRGVMRLAITPDSRLLVSGHTDAAVRLRRLPDGEALGTLKGHAHAVDCIAISPDGRWLASGSYDQTVRVWGLPYSELYVPVAQITPDGITRTQQMLQAPHLPDDKRKWLEFLTALHAYRYRHDIDIGERTIPIGAFDIEIEDRKQPNSP